MKCIYVTVVGEQMLMKLSVENWKEHKVYEEVDLGQNIISLRWVLSEKMKGDETVIKARFQDLLL